MSEALAVIEPLLLLACYGCGLVGARYWVGMHNNTVDGDTFRLMWPWAELDASNFNEEGQRCRRQFWKAWIAAAVTGAAYFAVRAIRNAT